MLYKGDFHNISDVGQFHGIKQLELSLVSC